MGSITKIQLSLQEMELVINTEWILSKHIIIKKVFEMFGDLNDALNKEAEPYHYLFPENIKYENGKISKGENYRLLPYVILDYPAFFWKKRTFAIRTMFWWGNFFSITLHLSGEHKEKYTSAGAAILPFLQKNDFYVCTNEDEWQHNFEPDNYISAPGVHPDLFKNIMEKDFFKIAKKTALTEWQHANEFIIFSFREIMQFLQLSCPAGKTGL